MHATSTPSPETSAKSLAFWLGLALVSILVLVYVVLIKSAGPAASGLSGPAIGRQLPIVALEPLTGDAAPVSLDELNGRVTVMNFWGTWCPPCIREFPEIVALGKRFADRPDFRLYLVSCGQEDDTDLPPLRDSTAAFLEASHVARSTFCDRGGSTRAAAGGILEMDGFSYPTTIILDRQATVRGAWVGYSHRAAREMEKLVDDLLNEPTSAAADSRAGAAEER